MELLKALKKIKKVCEKHEDCCDCPLRAVKFDVEYDSKCALQNNVPLNWVLVENADNKLFKG